MPETLTVRALCALYLRHCEIESVHGAEARADRQRTLRLFCEAHGDLPVSECKAFHLSGFIEAHAAWKSSATRRAKANAVRACFQWACNDERINRNPFARVRYAEAERRPELADDTFALVARLANKRFEAAFRFLRLTGCRLNELCEAEWPDIDLDRGVWTIHRHKSRRYTHRPKLVALVAQAVDLLLEIDRVAGKPNVFLNNAGNPWTRRTLGQTLRRMKLRHGIDSPATLHGIRHRFAGVAVANGAPLKLVAAQLGHSNTAVTERYYVSLEGHMDAIREAAERAQ